MNFFPFRDWLVLKPLSAGDWSFLFQETIDGFVWPFSPREGSYPPLDFFFQASAKVLYNLGLSWPLIERLVWFWPFLILTVFSAWYLAELFFKSKVLRFFSSLVFLFNTYILMVVGGGQMGVAMAYALSPLALGRFIKEFKGAEKHLRGGRLNFSEAMTPRMVERALAGVVLAVQIMYDPRIALITIAAAGLYWIINLLIINELTGFKTEARKIWGLIIPVVVALFLHSFWLWPAIWAKKSLLPAGYGETGWVEFLSFANFSDTISLLHPNWPENIFGKTYFMRPEFLLLPILAFSSLLFTRIKANKKRILVNRRMYILFFASLALIGAFLAKGSKPPFGEVYLWLFDHLPGMSLFRDPTKFYVLVPLSYSVLIPFSLRQFSQQPVILNLIQNLYRFRIKSGMTRKFGPSKNFKYLVLTVFLIYLFFLVKPVILGQLGGTFKAKEMPQEYVLLKNFLVDQEEFFRTFWLPQKQRFGFANSDHPAVEDSKLPSRKELLEVKVKYLIIPFDSEGEIFLEDRKYDQEQRLALEKEIDKVPWLKKIDGFGKIAVYEIQ